MNPPAPPMTSPRNAGLKRSPGNRSINKDTSNKSELRNHRSLMLPDYDDCIGAEELRASVSGGRNNLLVNRSIDSLRCMIFNGKDGSQSKLKLERLERSMKDLMKEHRKTPKGEDSTDNMETAATCTSSASLSLESSLFQMDSPTKAGVKKLHHSYNASARDLSQEFGINLDEQRRLMEQYELSRRSSCNYPTLDEGEEPTLDEGEALEEPVAHKRNLEDILIEDMIDVAPGVTMPLRNSQETWSAIVEGRTWVASCCCCSQELTVVEDARILACADCWVLSPVEKPEQRSSSGVCIGVKAKDIDDWLILKEAEASASFNQ